MDAAAEQEQTGSLCETALAVAFQAKQKQQRCGVRSLNPWVIGKKKHAFRSIFASAEFCEDSRTSGWYGYAWTVSSFTSLMVLA